MKNLLISLLILLCCAGKSFATGEPSTYFNIYVPPNNEKVGRDVCLIVTALYDSTTFTITDDNADGDNDDTKTGMLMAGQSYVLFIRNNGVNDDAPHSGEGTTKNDGDYFIITSSNLVFASQATLSDWQHDWLCSFNKTGKGQKFIVYSNKTSSSNNDINVFAYADSTQVTVKKISKSALLGQGYTDVDINGGTVVMQKMLNVGEDLIYLYGGGRNLLQPGETYIIETNKPVTVQYGALYGDERDGGGYVPSSNGSSSGDLFYFAVPYQSAQEQEIRIVSWDDNNTIYLDKYVSGAWVNIKTYNNVNSLKPADWVGRTENATIASTFRLRCTSGKKISVLECNWMETGSQNTSDMATMASSKYGTSSGKDFLVYMLPPSKQDNMIDPFTGNKLSYNTHAYVYAQKNCTVTVKDAYTNGTKLSRTYSIAAGRYADVNLTVSQWNSIYNGNGNPASGPERPYLLIQSDENISVMIANTNDNWLMYFGSSLPQSFSQTATTTKDKVIPGDTIKVVSKIIIPDSSTVTNANVEIKVSDGATVIQSQLKDSVGSVVINGNINASTTGDGTKVTFNNVPNLDSTGHYRVETSFQANSLGSDNSIIPNNSIIDVDTKISGNINGTYQQSSSSQGVQIQSLNTSNYAFSMMTNCTPATDTINSWNANWADVNNDGFPDLIVNNYDKTKKNYLYLNNQNGTFTNVANSNAFTATKTVSVVGSAVADLDNDGYLDILMGSNIAQQSKLFKTTGSGIYNTQNAGDVTTDSGYAQTVNFVDYDNDGKLDVFIAEYFPTSFCRLYHNEGNNNFKRVTDGEISKIAKYAMGSTWADYDKDGLMDLFVPVGGTVSNASNQNNLLFHNEGNGKFTQITTGNIVNDGGNSTASTWGDYDNDGYLDLFVSNASNEKNFLYHNNGNGTFTKITTGDIVNDIGHWHGCSWVDYDNDGWLDLFVVSDIAQGKKLYHNNHDGTFTSITNEIICAAIPNTIGTAWADYDKDGFQDLYVTTTGNNINYLYHNNGNSNNWINIKLVGTVSNKNGIGADVFVKANIGGTSVWQLREVCSTTGIGSQNHINAAFGLGNAGSIDSVKIKWPSGAIQYLTNVTINQYITCTEPSTGTVNGQVFLDADNNCSKGSNEKGIMGVKLKITPGNTYEVTDSSGNFSLQLTPGNYVITEETNAYWQTNCSSSFNITVTAGNGNSSVSIPNSAIQTGVDLYSKAGNTAFRRGFKNQIAINYGNSAGADFANGTLQVIFPSGIIPKSSSTPWTSVSGNVYTWNISTLNAASEKTLVIIDSVGLTYHIGDSVVIPIQIGNAGTNEIDNSNNICYIRDIVVGAIDPNDKQVSPRGFGKDGYVANAQTLTYTINFENMGSYEAENITVTDTLCDALDVSTFKFISATHTCTYEIMGNIIVFNFKNVHLPDKSSDKNKGFVCFQVNPKKGLPVNTKISNQANIVFDFEDAMATNTVSNTIAAERNEGKNLPLYINPNPLTGECIVKGSTDKSIITLCTMKIVDVSGKIVLEQSGFKTTEIKLNRNQLPPSQQIFIVQCTDINGVLYTGKLLVK